MADGSTAPQGSEAWRLARCGRITASNFADAISVPENAGEPYKSGPKKGQPRPASSAARDKLKRMLAFERITGIPVHEIGSKSMAWGTENEPLAREAYELETGLIVEQSGLVVHPDYPFLAASPDGLVGTDGGVEIKNPHDEAVHILTWEEGMPDEHRPQVMGNMLCCQRAWWDFCSHDIRCEETPGAALRLYRQRIMRDDIYIRSMLVALLQFEAELQQLVKRLQAKAA